MSDQPGLSHLQVLFEAALHDYEKQTGITLAKHPLAEQLQNCDSVESVTTVLRDQTQAFSEFLGNDKVLKPLEKVVSLLCKLSAPVNFGQNIGLCFSPVTAINTGLGILLSAVKGVNDSYDSLVNIFESIETFLRRLEIYTKITPTVAMTEMVVKILVELLSTLSLATKQIEQGKSKKLVKKLFGGEKNVEAVLQRLDRLTLDEARITAAQTFEVVCGLFQNMRVVMDDGKASADHVMEALKIMQQLASDLNKSKRDSLEQDIFRWLSPPDPWKNYHIACDSRHRGSASWFIQGNTFSEWKASEAQSSSLWIHGKPGAGKSVFCSTIIENIDTMRKAGLASLAFFFCDFREDQKKDLRGLLSSLLVQLAHQSDFYCDVIFKFYSEHAKGLRHSSDDALVRCLKDLLKLPGLAPVYLIVDALDECPNTSSIPSPRAKVLSFLEDLIESQIPNLRICVTSRLETDIKDVLDPSIFRSVSLHDQSEQKRDIGEYIKSVINTHSISRRWKANHKQLVINVLTEKADGMFRWVNCQVVYICGCIPARIQHVLADLPETLDETYQRSLREINKANLEFAHRLFQFVAVASRPLCVEELSELLAFDFKAGSVPKLQEDWRPEDPVHAVLSTCSSLLAVVDGGYHYGKVIQFSHYSVKEFLTSTRLAKARDINLHGYHVSITSAHTLVAQACLGILLHLDKDIVSSDSLEKWPLAEYAAEHWAFHARFDDESRSAEDGMKQLFDPSKYHFMTWIWIHDPENLGWTRNSRPLPPDGTPLHYAALCGLHSIVELLIIEHSQDVHTRDSNNKETPLHVASKNGHVKAVHMLIKHGADVTAQNKDGDTPLHLASFRGQVEAARMLIEYGAYLAARDFDENTPLHLASQKGQVEVARMLIERGADVAAQNKDGETPLHLASQLGQGEAARMLIMYGADVTAQNKDGDTPLHLASREDQVKVVCILIEHDADVMAQDYDGHTSLHLASICGQVDVTDMLIEHGADLMAQNKDGKTALHLASQKGHVEAARMLIMYGADVTAQNKDGDTPLHLASREDQVEVVCMLIEHDADVMAQDYEGHTSLHLASICGQVDVTDMLIKHGADLMAQNKDGKTPLHLASQLGQVEAARMFIMYGADVTAQNKDGHTPLHLASREDQEEIACMLIEHGADVMAQDYDGHTPLHLASIWGQPDVTDMLIKHGADVTAQSKRGETPLHQASILGHVGIVHMLIEHGADVMAQNQYGLTSLHVASQEGLVEVTRMLIERGADVMAQNEDGETPLHLASQAGHVEAARMLIMYGANVTSQNKDGNTPLHLASQEDHVEVARVLIECSANMAARNNDGSTSLYLASQHGHVEVVCTLIEFGAGVMEE